MNLPSLQDTPPIMAEDMNQLHKLVADHEIRSIALHSEHHRHPWNGRAWHVAGALNSVLDPLGEVRRQLIFDIPDWVWRIEQRSFEQRLASQLGAQRTRKEFYTSSIPILRKNLDENRKPPELERYDERTRTIGVISDDWPELKSAIKHVAACSDGHLGIRYILLCVDNHMTVLGTAWIEDETLVINIGQAVEVIERSVKLWAREAFRVERLTIDR